MVSVLVINLTRMKSHRALPWFIKKHLDGKLGDYLLLDFIADVEVNGRFLIGVHFRTVSHFWRARQLSRVYFRIIS